MDKRITKSIDNFSIEIYDLNGRDRVEIHRHYLTDPKTEIDFEKGDNAAIAGVLSQLSELMGGGLISIKEQMRTATIYRRPSCDEGTFGEWVSDSGFKCVTLERPADTENPCIPEGIYRCYIKKTQDNYCMVNGAKDYRLYELQDVPGRTDILIHSGNFFFQILGCILVGAEIVPIETRFKTMMMGVSHSRASLTGLMADMAREPFLLTIVNAK